MPPTGQPTIDFSNLDDLTLSQMLKDYGIVVGPINAATRSTYERRLMKLKAGVVPVPRYEPVADDDEEDEVSIKRTSGRQLLESTKDAATSPAPQPVVINGSGQEVPARRTYQEKPLKPRIGVTSSPRPWPTNNAGDDEDDEVQVRRPEPSSRPVPVLSQPPQVVLRKVREEFSPRIESRPSLPSHRMTPSTYDSPVSRSAPTKAPQGKSKSSLLWLKLIALAVAIILLYLIYANMEPAAHSNIPGIQNKIEV